MTTTTARKRRRPHRINAADGNLIAALDALHAAAAALIRPQPGPAQPRYLQLRDALDITASHAGAGDGTTRTPCWIDALLLLIRIDRAATHINPHVPHASTPQRIAALLTGYRWRPQDTGRITAIANEIHSWTLAIDDLFAPKPVYLPDPCPHCGQTHTHRVTDTGETIRTAALAVTAERGAICQSCHDVWPPDQLPFLARRLGYQPPQGITA